MAVPKFKIVTTSSSLIFTPMSWSWWTSGKNLLLSYHFLYMQLEPLPLKLFPASRHSPLHILYNVIFFHPWRILTELSNDTSIFFMFNLYSWACNRRVSSSMIILLISLDYSMATTLYSNLESKERKILQWNEHHPLFHHFFNWLMVEYIFMYMLYDFISIFNCVLQWFGFLINIFFIWQHWGL